jgi:acylpyruvate hydrolase
MRTARLASGGELPIGKILCIGRNYTDHIRELGNETPEAPVIFIKPSSSVIGDGGAIVIPPYSRECHHEVELALLIGKTGKNIPADRAMEHISGYGVAIDLTLRDVQGELKKKGLPWEIAKGFDTACPLSAFVEASRVADPHALRIRLAVNGESRQDGHTSMMIHRIPDIIRHMSGCFTLEPGDVILTGTPAGVGRIVSGDRLSAVIPGVAALNVMVV